MRYFVDFEGACKRAIHVVWLVVQMRKLTFVIKARSEIAEPKLRNAAAEGVELCAVPWEAGPV